MGIWDYSDQVLDKGLVTKGLKLKTCPFCRTKLQTITKFSDGPTHNTETEDLLSSLIINVCLVCGWWGTASYMLGKFQNNNGDEVRYAQFGALATLRNLNLSDLSTPIDEVRQFLIAKYDSRHSIHPRLFEETVASVFKGLGYKVKVTAYSGDGGIDVVLEEETNREVGVQVKRYKGTIQVEQIRAFAGALLLGGYTKGVYVTTSRFASGASKTATAAALRGIEIELVDADSFYAALEISQMQGPSVIDQVVSGVRQQRLMLLEKKVY